jgi:ATP-binding cassette subfamily C (CFTR/MRP) protein 1
MNAVERLLYYADNIDQEREIKENGLVSEEWPQRGEIEFSDVKMSHRPGLPLALKGVNLKINEGEHIGIVGRTGAGKSSIMAALFRMAELESGTITIDGVDTSQVPLQN